VPQQQATSFGDDLARLRAEFEADLARVRQQPTTPSVPEQLLDQTGRFVRGGADAYKNLVLHPVDAAVGIATTPYHILKGHSDLGVETWEDLKAGNYGQATVNGLLSVMPALGPYIKSAIEAVQEGRGAEWAGEQAAMLGLGRVLAGRGPRPPKPVEEGAQIARWGQQQGVPPRLGDAVGGVSGRFLSSLDHAAENTTFAGAKLIGDQSLARSRGLATLGEQLQAKGGLRPVERAEAVRQAQQRIARDVRQLADESASEYIALETIESELAQRARLASGQADVPPPLSVNLEQFRLDPGARKLYRSIQRTRGVGPPNSSAGMALQSLDNLLESDVVLTLSEADKVLSGFKYVQRQMRNGQQIPGVQSRQVIDSIVSRLDAMVNAAARRGGPEVVDALSRGRQLWKEKTAAQEFFDALEGEPSAIIGKITRAEDGGINYINTMRQFAPEQLNVAAQSILSKLVQSVIDPRLRDTSLSSWQKLGPETKLALWKDPAYISDLDNFFQLAKQVKANMNPSGSGYRVATAAHTGTALGGGAGAFLWGEGAAVLSAAINSPAAVNAIVRYLKAPSSQMPGLRERAFAAIQQAAQQWKQAASGRGADLTTTRRAVVPSRAQGAGPVGR